MQDTLNPSKVCLILLHAVGVFCVVAPLLTAAVAAADIKPFSYSSRGCLLRARCCLLVASGCPLQAAACVMPLSLCTAGAMYRGIAATVAWAGTAAHMLRRCSSQQPHSPAPRRRHRVSRARGSSHTTNSAGLMNWRTAHRLLL